jgi:TolB-like protein
MRVHLTLIATLTLALAGCSLKELIVPQEPESQPAAAPMPMYRPAAATDITRHSYAAADALIEQMRATVPPATPLIVSTLVNINSLDDSSPFGRLMTEQVAARLVQGGYQVIEVKLRNQLYMKRNEGELMLTRELRDIARKHSASVVVTGTYTDSPQRVFVNIKAVRLENNLVAGAVDVAIDRDATVRALLGAKR